MSFLQRFSIGGSNSFFTSKARQDTHPGSMSDGILHRSETHVEHHSHHSQALRDSIIGFADGMTVPFALTAGLSTLGSSRLVILGGLAELFSGSISMGLGAYLAALSDRQLYKSEEARERWEVENKPLQEEEEVHDILAPYGIDREISQRIVEALRKDKDQWIQFMMDFELKMEKPQTRDAWISALIMGASYFVGGLIPMIPYFAMKNVSHALLVSIGISIVVLLAFGYAKSQLIVSSWRAAVKSAVQTLAVGAIAATASYGIVRGVNSSTTL